MPYPAGHRSIVRKRIIDSARGLFNLHGFESVSIQKIMARAGLTHGGFYSYFDSKGDLYAEVLSCFFTDPTWKNNWKGVVIASPKTLDRKSSVPIFLAGTSRMLRTLAQWSRCPPMYPAAANPRKLPSKMFSPPWSICSTAARTRSALRAPPKQRRLPLYV